MNPQSCMACAKAVGSESFYRLYIAYVDDVAMQMKVDGYLCPSCYRFFERTLGQMLQASLVKEIEQLRLDADASRKDMANPL